MRDLKEQYYGSFRRGFEVEKIAELSREQFERFSGELYGYYRFLYDNRDVMYMGPGDRNMHCILVTTSEYREGILVEAEGYAYPRYAAFVPDCRRIDLEGKEVLAQADLSSNRLNAKELRLLDEQVKRSGLSREEFLRSLIVGAEVRAKPCEHHADLLRKVAGLCNNANQLAHVANAAGRAETESVREMLRISKEVWQIVKEEW